MPAASLKTDGYLVLLCSRRRFLSVFGRPLRVGVDEKFDEKDEKDGVDSLREPNDGRIALAHVAEIVSIDEKGHDCCKDHQKLNNLKQENRLVSKTLIFLPCKWQMEKGLT